MKTIKWKLDLSHLNEQEMGQLTDKKIFENYLLTALRLGFKDGLSMDYQRKLFKILDKLEKTQIDSIELEDAEFEMVDEAFSRAKFNPEAVRLVNQIYDFLYESKQK